MGRWSELIGQYLVETKTYTALAGAEGASPFTPSKDAMLVELRIFVNADAATTLTEHVTFRLTSKTFDPNAIEVGVQGAGLRTAPAFTLVPEVWPIMQKVRAGVPITMEGKNITADTPIGCNVLIYAVFEG